MTMAVESCGDFDALPEECIAKALSLTTPQDVCRLSAVAPNFRSASQSDTVWNRFLPPDYPDILSRSDDASDLVHKFHSKKDLYLYLCDHPVLLDGGKKRFALDKLSGRKCFVLSARELYIVWGDSPQYWRWISLPESSFSEVAELLAVCWFEIHGKINLNLLSPGTKYAAYLVFKTIRRISGFDYTPVEAFISVNGQVSEKQSICLDPEGAERRRYQIAPRRRGVFRYILNVDNSNATRVDDEKTVYPTMRSDGWMEVELGEYFVNGYEDGELEATLMEVNRGNWKSGMVVEGIEFRPKKGSNM